MNNTRLISKYGEPIQIDGVGAKAYFEDSLKTYYTKKTASYSSFDIEVIHTISEISLDAVVLLKSQNFGVLESKPVFTSGVLSYSETVCFKDDFINDISIGKEKVSKSGINMPNATGDAPIATKARIKTVSPIDYPTIAFRGEKVPLTHIFVLRYVAGVNAGDIVTFGTRRFEILSFENINETDTLLLLNCAEVF